MGGRLEIDTSCRKRKSHNSSQLIRNTTGIIGAVARTILNFGIKELRVVGRDGNWSDEARNRAKHAQQILENCMHFESINQAVEDCSLVIGTSGKREIGDKISFRHFCYARGAP